MVRVPLRTEPLWPPAWLGRKVFPSASPADWVTLAVMRWGPAIDDPTPRIDVPKDWRDDVANLPHPQWEWWRHRSGRILIESGRHQTIDTIQAADRQAWDELREIVARLTA